jgi:hypothetical protein
MRNHARSSEPRSSERGAAMFVVLMVILILSAIGTFALSNARYEVQAAGFGRHRAVSQDAAQLGGAAAMAEVGGQNRAAAYLDRMKRPGTVTCKANQGMFGMPCAHIYLADVERRAGLTTEGLFRKASMTSTPVAPGSLGINTLTGGFDVQLTEPLEITKPLAGYSVQVDQGQAGQGSSAATFVDITVTSTGVVWDDNVDANGKIDWSLGEGGSAVFTEGRGHILIGPILKSASATTVAP